MDKGDVAMPLSLSRKTDISQDTQQRRLTTLFTVRIMTDATICELSALLTFQRFSNRSIHMRTAEVSGFPTIT